TVTGLKRWQQHFGQDKNSWERTMAMPAELASSLRNEQTNMDWSVLASLASRVESGNLKRQPGPQNK
ncbi:MAG: hypothetical protein ACREBC_11035, partial [Pyrinomonadaceae bacterium]